MRCDECKHWSKDTDNHYPESFNFGKCTRVKLFWECTKWDDSPDGEYDLMLTDDAEGNKAFVQDGSDYKAELITVADFGCVQFESA